MEKKAFTLLEVMISVTMLTFTALTIFTISKSSKALMASSEDRATAMYLAQEWIELIRNMRDTQVWQSTNKWRDNFLNDIWFSGSEKVLVKKIKWEFSLEGVDKSFFNKKISSIDQICVSFYDNCDFEVIETKKEWERSWKAWEWTIFFRKINIKKEDWENNLITIKSSIYWDYKWEVQNFSLETKLWNITIQ